MKCHCGHIEDDHQEDYGCYECESSGLDFRHEFDADVEGYEEGYSEPGDDPGYRASMKDAGRGHLLR